MKKSYTYIILGVAMCLVPSVGVAQGVLSPRAVITASCKDSDGAMKVSADEKAVTVFVTIDEQTTSWLALGLTPMSVFGNTATVRLTLGELKDLASREGVRYVQITAGVNQTLDKAREEAGVNDVHKGVSLPQQYTGKGVVVGIVDAGFDYMHSAFRNPEDGSLRIKRVWEQTSSKIEGAKAPEKFGYGIELTTPELINMSKADTEDNSHGSHVACIAAGSDNYNDGAYIGNAPDADIVLVAIDLNACTSADICNGVQYIFDYADEVGKPCVVNLSLANNDGPHDGTSTFDVMTDQMQKAGRLIVGAAGNFRKDKFHIDHSFASSDDAPLKTFVDYKSKPSTSVVGGVIDIWGDEGTDFTVDVSAYNLFSKKDVVSTTVYPTQEDLTEVSFGNYAKGVWKVVSEISPLNGKPHVLLTSALTNLRNNYAIALTVTPKGNGRVNMWADNGYVGLSSKDIEGFSEPDASSSTVCEIGGTGKKILTVGAYTTRNEFTTPSASGSLDETIGDISSFSSFGPTADGRLKPEVAAPGCLVVSAVSNYDNSGNLQYAEWYDKFDRTNSYGYMQGTSMSSPFVAGVVAMWLQAYPELSPEQLHEIIETTSRKDNFTSVEADNNWGYGKINPMAGLKECIELETAGCENVDMPFDGSVTVYDGRMVIDFPRDAHVKVSVADIMGNLVVNKDMGYIHAGETVVVPLPSLQKGMYLFNVETGTEIKSFKMVRR